ncbi:MAG: hypothetical protein K6G63_06965 [Eubacterium sp.]|nr:hypothetical protein [Eubacterium sp.]
MTYETRLIDSFEDGFEQGREEGLKQGREEAFKQGLEEVKEEIAKNLLIEVEWSIEKIAIITGVDSETLERLREEVAQ